MTRTKKQAAILVLVVSGALALGSSNRAGAWSSTPPARGLGATAPSVVEPIVKQMKTAQTRLKGGDTGSDTRGIQEQVIRDIDKLIDAAQRQSDPSQSSRNSQSGNKPSQEPEGGSPQKSKSSQDAGAQGASGRGGPGPSGGTRRSQPVKAKTTLAAPNSLLREVWGHLPPAMREHVRVDFSETVLPAYDELVRRYFEALLEEPPQRTGTMPSTNKPAPAEK